MPLVARYIVGQKTHVTYGQFVQPMKRAVDLSYHSFVRYFFSFSQSSSIVTSLLSDKLFRIVQTSVWHNLYTLSSL